MSDRDRSSPSLTDTPLKTYIGRHDDDYPLINGNAASLEFVVSRRVVLVRWQVRIDTGLGLSWGRFRGVVLSRDCGQILCRRARNYFRN
ncbi:hypothetical protein RR48_08988 [Papilio machaon]|uniref:Uncharacterized protein n=1 Tax=Papilio machaon TaxID=76193 RepID=A0A194QXR2_PAPMA|nr:hypothetical protein RR48_08988 [Papilio machaon]